jgi:hypothetical protein
VTVAAHEVGHALQHAEGYAPLLRHAPGAVGEPGGKTGAVLMMLTPVILGVTRLPLAACWCCWAAC